MNDAQVDVVRDQQLGRDILVFSGELLFRNIPSVKQKLDDFFSSWDGGVLTMRVENLTGFDLGFLQMLEVIANYLKGKGVEFSVAIEFDNETKSLLSQTGFEKYA